jgi:tripartite-type tricarboxylate transporter receptor subunit TctC
MSVKGFDQSTSVDEKLDSCEAELAASLRDPRVAKQLNETQQVTFALGGPEELRKFVSEQMRLWGPVAREHNIQAD